MKYWECCCDKTSNAQTRPTRHCRTGEYLRPAFLRQRAFSRMQNLDKMYITQLECSTFVPHPTTKMYGLRSVSRVTAPLPRSGNTPETQHEEDGQSPSSTRKHLHSSPSPAGLNCQALMYAHQNLLTYPHSYSIRIRTASVLSSLLRMKGAIHTGLSPTLGLPHYGSL